MTLDRAQQLMADQKRADEEIRNAYLYYVLYTVYGCRRRMVRASEKLANTERTERADGASPAK